MVSTRSKNFPRVREVQIRRKVESETTRNPRKQLLRKFMIIHHYLSHEETKTICTRPLNENYGVSRIIIYRSQRDYEYVTRLGQGWTSG